jgi:alkanesulfonate monooxygenase SsuD/methylene tetrahydromethanopterin reductase-like flavin-dependent oxidoreductase (luciferase family)
VDERLAPLRAAGQTPPPLCGTVDEVASQLEQYAAAGVERAMLQHLAHEDVEMVTVLGEIAAQLQ